MTFTLHTNFMALSDLLGFSLSGAREFGGVEACQKISHQMGCFLARDSFEKKRKAGCLP